MKAQRTATRGFTLVEILIVVIILGILAAIVIPQFTNASEDARKSSLTSQLQTIRSQVELYKLQHRDTYPTSDGTSAGTWDWTKLTTRTDETGAADASGFGPYLQSVPANSLRRLNNTVVAVVADDDTALASEADAGWIFSSETGKFWARVRRIPAFTSSNAARPFTMNHPPLHV